MLLQIVHQTPLWVFVLFAALLGLGLSQLRARSVALGRVLGVGFGLCAFSLYGTLSAFGRLPLALLGWVAGAALVLLWLLRRPAPAGTRYDPVRRRLQVPGSAWPLALMMGIFLTKYGAAVATVMHPVLARDLRFALPACLIYGACSGAFVGRALRLWRLARRPSDAAASSLPAVTGAAS